MEIQLQKSHPELPALPRDWAFRGMTATQFLGALNDNVFKQLVLLICVDYLIAHNLQGDVYQFTATLLFTIPFLMFSGFAGFLSDRYRKRSIIILSKVGEVAVMSAGVLAFYLGQPGSTQLIGMLFVVLFFMGTQTSFFGPAKYGILPEMFNGQDLPAANATLQMVTFLAVIFGMALAGVLKQGLGEMLWMISALCVAVAIAGTLTATLLRPTAVARPELPFETSCLLIERQTWRYLRSDRLLWNVLLVNAVFWFVGAALLPTINVIGKKQLNVGDSITGLLAACMGLGIAMGCIASARLCRHTVNFAQVRIGAWGVVLALVSIALICVLPADSALRAALVAVLLLCAGIFGGLLAVPLQVFLQVRPPSDKKGRVIGAMNLITWCGILASTFFYFLSSALMAILDLPGSWTLAALAAVMSLVAVGFRPRNQQKRLQPGIG